MTELYYQKKNESFKHHKNKYSKKEFFREFGSNWQLYLMAIPTIVWFAIFSYYPLVWLQIAFKDFNIMDGLFGSPFTKHPFDNFKFYFTSDYFGRTTFNTLFLNALGIISITFAAVIIAILLNEIQKRWVKKLFQSAIFLPHFLSTIIVAAFVYSMLGDQFGMVNTILKSLGFQPIAFYSIAGIWPIILTLVAVWQGSGFNSIIYLSAITSIDPELYEAARIDGATRWCEIKHITIPHLLPTVSILVLLAVGKIFSGNFSLIYSIVGNNGLLFPTTDVIDTYVYRGLVFDGAIGQSTAVGLYQSVMGLITVLFFNKLAKKLDDSYGLF